MRKKINPDKRILAIALLTIAFSFPSYGLDPKLAPGKNFNLSAFKLQTMTDALAFVEVASDTLTKGFTNRFFYTDSIDGSMVFYTPSNGGKTANSQYPRTELRQTGGGANWKMADTALYRMTASCRVTRAPSANPTVVIGQIHGSNTNSELIELEWNGNSAGNCRVFALFQTNDAAGSAYVVNVVTGLSLGALVSYELTMKKGVVNVSVNGKSVSTTYTTQYYGTTDGYYFKAGNYLQYSNSTQVWSEVKFYSLVLGSSAPTSTIDRRDPVQPDAATLSCRSNERAVRVLPGALSAAHDLFTVQGRCIRQSGPNPQKTPAGIFFVKMPAAIPNGSR
jgi:hypothetical protein